VKNTIKEEMDMMEFLTIFLTGMAAGGFLVILPKAHKKAENKYWNELEKPRYEALEKYRAN